MDNYGLHEECGVFGIYSKNGDCARDTYYGLYALQHRGQESAGIAANNDRVITCYKDMGLVGDVFSEKILDELNGTMAIGHVRYSTTGTSSRDNAQPLSLRYVKNELALVHNGNLVNSQKLKNEYELSGSIFQSNSDTEVIAYSIARERLRCSSVEEALSKAMEYLEGAYCLILMSSRKLIAARDPWGFRPLCMGRRGDDIVFSSESCALDGVNAVFERELEPGEIVVVEDGKIRSIKTHCGKHNSHFCIFEYIYFARPDSIVNGQSVHNSRLEAGRLLARQCDTQADIVVGVPDSGLDAAMGYAQESGLQYTEGFLKNRYIGRTFIQPTQSRRENAVKLKHNPVKSLIEGKRVIMVEDSIVRGTTTKQVVDMLRNAGATQVHMKVASPLFIGPCYYGTDIPDKSSLLACKYSVEEIRQQIGVDSLDFLSIDSLSKITPDASCGMCDACFTENYPIEKEE